MELLKKVSVKKEMKDSKIVFRSSQITETLKLIFSESESEKKMETILLNFWNEYDKCMSEEEDFCVFDFLCMYVLDYVYLKSRPLQSDVSRSLYYYLERSNAKGQNAIINRTDDIFLKNLHEFTSFNSAEGEDMLIDALVKSIIDGNFGLALFLLKFALVEIPVEANEKSRRIMKTLINRFADIFQYVFGNEHLQNLRTPIILDEMLDLMRRSETNFRRSLMSFFVIVVILENKLQEKIDVGYLKIIMQQSFAEKLICLYTIFDAIAEPKFTYKDIESFVVNVLNPFITENIGKSLMQFSQKVCSKTPDPLDPRSLKDLSRSAIRANRQNSMTFPEQVSQFHIPVDLKEFILFGYEGILDLLKGYSTFSPFGDTVHFFLNRNVHPEID